VKRGQFTLFIILGIFIILIIGISYYYINNTSSSGASLSGEISVAPEAQEYYDEIDSCLEEIVETSIVDLGMQGGYYDVPEPYFDLELYKIPYFYNDGEEDNGMNVETFAGELNKYLERDFVPCVTEIEAYEKYFFIDEEDLETKISIFDTSIEVEMILPTEVKITNGSYDFEDYYYEAEYQIPKMLELKNKVLEYTVEYVDEIPMTKLMELFEEEEMEIEVNIDFNEVMYVINDVDYSYYFMVKYNWFEEE
jgi:hypothetical protein